MAEDDQTQHRATPAPERRPQSLPQGYRQGIITAITVLLGFSLTFFRFWGFEASGTWTVRSLISTGTLGVAVVLQIMALFRSLRLEDDDAKEYRKTVLWFIASAVVLLLGLVFAIMEFSGVGGIAPHYRV
jgi:hypothetical protein